MTRVQVWHGSKASFSREVISIVQGAIMILQSQQRHFANLWLRFLPSVTIALLLGSTIIQAQRIGVTYNAEAQTDAALKQLLPASQAVMARLSRLDRLPMGDLRYHAGSLANGGAVDLDDSSWQNIQVPFIASADAIWLRKWIEVPKNIGRGRSDRSCWNSRRGPRSILRMAVP